MVLHQKCHRLNALCTTQIWRVIKHLMLVKSERNYCYYCYTSKYIFTTFLSETGANMRFSVVFTALSNPIFVTLKLVPMIGNY